MKKSIKTIMLLVLMTSCLSDRLSASTHATDLYALRISVVDEKAQKSMQSFFALQVQDSVNNTVTDSILSSPVTAGRPKDPFKAFVFAVVPGVIAHGTGHFYAGKAKTGLLLLGSGIAGGFLMFVGGTSDWGASSPNAERFPLALAGGALFFGSWIYDMVGAPLAVQKHNATLIQRKPVGMELRMRDGQPRLVAVWRF